MFVVLTAVLGTAILAISAIATTRPNVETLPVSGVSQNSTTLRANLTRNDAPIVDVWFEWWPKNDSSDKQETKKKTFYTDTITERYSRRVNQSVQWLKADTAYCYRAVAKNSQGLDYGDDFCFTTPSGGSALPLAYTLQPKNVENDKAELGVDIQKLGNPTKRQLWIRYYRQSTPQKKFNTEKIYIYETGKYYFDVEDLMPGDLYCYKAQISHTAYTPASYSPGYAGYYSPYPYACSGNDCAKYPNNTYYHQGDPGVYHGGGSTYSTKDTEEVCFYADTHYSNDDEPEVITLSAQDIDRDSARLRGDLEDMGGDSSVNVWFEYKDYYSTTFRIIPIVHASQVSDDETRTHTGEFDIYIDDLEEDERYYFRAVAENSEGYDYGAWEEFRTGDDYNNSEIDDVWADDIDRDSARLHVDIEDLNDDEVRVYFEYGDNYEHRTHTYDVDEEGDFYVRIYDLEEDERYYFRAVVRNDNGITYSNRESFTTDNDSNTRPDIDTLRVESIGDTYVTLYGDLIDLGDDNDANIWFEYGTDSSMDEETERLYRTNEGEFHAYIENLEEDDKYYFRAVAENRDGTTYGDTLTFRTDDDWNNGDRADVETLSADDVEDESAILRLRLDDLGDDNEVRVWIEYGESRSFGQITSKRYKSREGIVEFRVYDLEEDEQYYFRAVAQNDHGRSYGNTKTLRTNDTVYGTKIEDNDMSLDIRVRNLSKNDSLWKESTSASPADTLAFRVDVRNNTNDDIDDVITKIRLNARIYDINSISINGKKSYDDIKSLDIGDFDRKEIKVILFKAKLRPDYNFSFGLSSLINVAYISDSDPMIAETCKVNVSRYGVSGISIAPSSVVTGFENSVIDFLVLPLILSIIVLAIFRKKLKHSLA